MRKRLNWPIDGLVYSCRLPRLHRPGWLLKLPGLACALQVGRSFWLTLMDMWFRLYSASFPLMKLLTRLRVMVKTLRFLCCRGMLCVEAPSRSTWIVKALRAAAVFLVLLTGARSNAATGGD